MRYFGAGEYDFAPAIPILSASYPLMLEASALLKRAGFKQGKRGVCKDKPRLQARKEPTRKPESAEMLQKARLEPERRFKATNNGPAFNETKPGKAYRFVPASYDSIIETVKESDTNDRRNGWKLTR